MSFSKTSRDIHIDREGDETVLYALVQMNDGVFRHDDIHLDKVIGNDDGWFTRKHSNFTQSASDIKLEFREDGVWLVAKLPRHDQSFRELQGINLDLHITNQNGHLTWVPEN